MVWNYLFSSEGENSFDPQLLEHIKDKNNEQVQVILQDAKNLCNAVDSSGASLLHYSAEYGNEVITQVLLESGAKVNLPDAKGQTPLILATKGEHEDTIRVLLDHDADIYVTDKNGISALKLAVHEILMLPNIIEMFLAQIEIDSSTSEDIARKLLKVNCPIYIAVHLRNIDVVERMLSDGSSIDVTDPNTNQTALHVAVKNEDVEMVKLLVDRGADVNAFDVKNQTPLALITTFNDLEILKVLANGKTDLTACTEDGFMQIYWILTEGTCEAVKLVVQSGIDLRAKDSLERTGIHYLARNVNAGIVDILDDWVNDKKTKSVFHFILYIFLRISIVNITKKSVDWNAKDKNGRTILHDAMAVGNASFVKYLMKKGVDANVKTAEGNTPFFEALMSESSLEQRVECVKFIMNYGAYPDVEIKRYLGIRNTKSAINRDFSILEPVLAHLVLRQAKGERISEKLLETIDSHLKLKDYVASCKEELEEMKKLEIWEIFLKPVTLFDFLTEPSYKLAVYVQRCFKIKKLVDKYKFDSYYSRILRQRSSDITKYLPFMKTTLGQAIFIAMIVIFMLLFCTLYIIDHAPESCRLQILSEIKYYVAIAILMGILFYIYYVYSFLRDINYYSKSRWVVYTKNLLVR